MTVRGFSDVDDNCCNSCDSNAPAVKAYGVQDCVMKGVRKVLLLICCCLYFCCFFSSAVAATASAVTTRFIAGSY
jgi:hypothetical protein